MGDPGIATASDNCYLASLDYDDVTTSERCPIIIERTWTATDSCGNSTSCLQTITIQDTTKPVLTCAPDDTVECDVPVVFTPPNVLDNCDPAPIITVVSTDTTAGPGEGEFTHTRCWVAIDSCGNVSDPCCQSIIVEPCLEPCTFTMGGWGSGCPASQQDDWESTQPGCIRDHYFDFVFTSGEVVIGHHSGYTARWTSAGAVEAYLPAGSTPGILTDDLINPLTTPAGVLAGQILALRLNREYSCANVFTILGVPTGGACYGNVIISSDCGNGKFDGMSVDAFLAMADKVLSGKTNLLKGYGATLSDLNFTATCLNELHDNCDLSSRTDGLSAAASSPEAAKAGEDDLLPMEFTLNQNHPNPFNPVTEISFGLPQACNVKLEIFNVVGQKVATLVEGYFEAGAHTVVWDGTRVASGVYLYRLEADDFVSTKKMVLLK